MKPTRIILTLLLLASIFPAIAQQQEEGPDSAAVLAEYAKVEASFEKVVQKYVDFFQVKQKLVYKEANKKSKSGSASYIIEYTCQEINYGLNNTNNTITPYEAFVLLEIKIMTNQPCGKVPGTILMGPSAGWASVQEALANDKSTCFRTQVKVAPYQVQINFDYKDGQWVFKDVRKANTRQRDLPLAAVLGKVVSPAQEIQEPDGIDYNQKWLVLLGK